MPGSKVPTYRCCPRANSVLANKPTPSRPLYPIPPNNRDPKRRPRVNRSIGPRRNREYLLIRKVPDLVNLPRTPMQQTSIDRSHPEVRFISRKTRHMQVAQTVVQVRKISAVVGQHPAFSVPKSTRPMPSPSTAVTFRALALLGRRWRNRLPSNASMPSPEVPIQIRVQPTAT